MPSVKVYLVKYYSYEGNVIWMNSSFDKETAQRVKRSLDDHGLKAKIVKMKINLKGDN